MTYSKMPQLKLMKLLEKSTLNSIKQAEQKTAIDAGVNLARKIDILRAQLLELEKRRNDFINGSRNELENALKELKNTKSNLDSEISAQRNVLAKLREPLDEEWHKLSIGQIELADLNEKANVYFAEIVEKRKQLRENTKKVDAFLETAYKQKNESDEILKKANEDRRTVQETLDRAQKLEDDNGIKYYNEGLRLSKWEKTLKVREETLKKEQLVFNKEKKALETRKSRWKIS